MSLCDAQIRCRRCGHPRGDSPAHPYDDMIGDAVQSILERCDELQDDWDRAKDNVRLFYEKGESGGEEGEESSGTGFGGGSSPNGDWLLISYEWLDADAELGLTHELVHLHGLDHPDDDAEATEAFEVMEERCSGGRNA